MLNGWEGKDINDLIYSWGPPGSTFTMPNSNKMFTWDKVKVGPTITSTSGSAVYVGSGISVGGGSSLSTTEVFDCHTTFVTNPAGTILSWTLKGNSCSMAYTSDEYHGQQSGVEQQCQTLKPNAAVQLFFYFGAKSDDGKLLNPSLTGFFQKCTNGYVQITTKAVELAPVGAPHSSMGETGFFDNAPRGYTTISIPTTYVEEIALQHAEAEKAAASMHF